jgi:hypothetical protein
MRNGPRFFIVGNMNRIEAARLTAHRNFSDLGREIIPTPSASWRRYPGPVFGS